LSAGFQSRSGFSGRRDALDGRDSRDDVWRFQSRSGFSGRRDSSVLSVSSVISVFQSRSGFSGCRDSSSSSRSMLFGMFQSRSGFSGCRDDLTPAGRNGLRHVSIPFWVFWVSRHYVADILAPLPGFNPVLGFLGVATRQRRAPHGGVVRFQSRSGFSGCRDGRRPSRCR